MPFWEAAMIRKACALVLILAMGAAVLAEGPVAEGKWLLATVSATGESVQCILKLESKDGKLTPTVIFAPPNIEVSAADFRVSDKEVSFTLKQIRTIQGRQLPTEQKFVGYVGGNAKQILGSLGEDRLSLRAKLVATDKESLTREELTVRAPAVEPYTKAQQLNVKPTTLAIQYQREQDPEKKKELQKQATEARKEAEEQAPGLYREVVAKHAESQAALDAALFLVRAGARVNLKPEEAANLVALIQKQAAPYGPRFSQSTLLQVAELLVAQKGMESVALGAIEPIARGLSDGEKANTQVRVLSTFKTALEKTGKTNELAAIETRLGKLESALDAEYLANVPPFKPQAYAGRKNKDANQVVVMELFTGAQCPPCVAADVAFDALGKSYKHTDLVLIQYHMHIPGPDPLTNPDCMARWGYYREKFPEGIRGTPSTIFNGKPEAGGGGGMANAENKLQQYRGIIDPLLEQKAAVTLTGKATLSGDKVDISVGVENAAAANGELKLRLVLVEENVRYVGGNGLRFHHYVVRAMPGGAAGVAVKDKTLKHTVTADITEIKKGLTKYLDEFASTQSFPYPARPMDMKHLKVIAFVQNDATREILQGTMIDVGDVQGASAR
jgi:hypothetical protein